MMRMISSEFLRDDFRSSIKLTKASKSVPKDAITEENSLESDIDNLLLPAQIPESEII